MDEKSRELLREWLRPTVREDAQRRLAELEVEHAGSNLTRTEMIDLMAANLEDAIERAKEVAAPDFPNSERLQVTREVINEVLLELRAKAAN